jgi:hypothetical protein
VMAIKSLLRAKECASSTKAGFIKSRTYRL